MIKLFKSKNFIKYFIVGVLATITSTLMLIMLVDYVGVWVGLANPIVIAIIFLLKYILYDKVGMISKVDNGKRIYHTGIGISMEQIKNPRPSGREEVRMEYVKNKICLRVKGGVAVFDYGEFADKMEKYVQEARCIDNAKKYGLPIR